MAEHQYRAPRISAQFPLCFAVEGVEYRGTCVNISESGMLADFSRALDLWTVGEVTVYFGEGVLGIRARVARVMENQAGLVFLSGSEEDRQAIRAGIASAKRAMGIPESGGTPPF